MIKILPHKIVGRRQHKRIPKIQQAKGIKQDHGTDVNMKT